MGPLSAATAAIIGAAVGSVVPGIVTIVTAVLSRKTEQDKLNAQARDGALALLRGEMKDAYGELLNESSQWFNSAPDDPDHMLGVFQDDWEVMREFGERIEAVRLVSNEITVRSAEQLVQALLYYLFLKQEVKKQDGATGSVISEAVDPERQTFLEARNRYVRCVQDAVGLTPFPSGAREEMEKKLAASERPSGYLMQEPLEKLAKERVQRALTRREQQA